MGSWWEAVVDSVPRRQQEQGGGGRESEEGSQPDIPDGVDKRGKRRGQGRGRDRGKQAISDEDLFQDLLGGYSTDVYGYGESRSWVEEEVQFDGGVKGGTTGNGRWENVDDQFLLDDLVGGANFFLYLILFFTC